MTAPAVARPQVAVAVAPAAALVRGDLVLTPDGFIATVRWVFTGDGEPCANVQRLGGYPGSFPVRVLRKVA